MTRSGVAAVMVALLVAGCTGQPDRTEGGATTGHVDLTFSGAVTGRASGPAEVVCSEPVEDGDRSRVAIDIEDGLPVGAGVRLVALDAAATDTGAEHDAGDYFLLFDHGPDPFVWSSFGGHPRAPGNDEPDGSVTFDGARGGRIALRGWRDAQEGTVHVDGVFTCGPG
ncbi:MAG: hypothetical protein ACRDZ3_12435 [Acidimicrobiia bacterium]